MYPSQLWVHNWPALQNDLGHWRSGHSHLKNYVNHYKSDFALVGQLLTDNYDEEIPQLHNTLMIKRWLN